MIELLLSLAVAAILLVGIFFLYNSAVQDHKTNKLISEWKSIHTQLDDLISRSYAQVTAQGQYDYRNYYMNNLVSSYPQTEIPWGDGTAKLNSFTTDYGRMYIDFQSQLISSTPSNANDARYKLNGFTIHLSEGQINQKTCFRLIQDIKKLPYIYSMSIGDEFIYFTYDSDEDKNDKIKRACDSIEANPTISAVYFF